VADAGHQLLRRDPRHAGDRGRRVVAKVMDAETNGADARARCSPRGRKGCPPKRSTAWTREHHAARTWGREAVHVLAERLGHRHREHNRPGAGLAPRVSRDASEVRDLVGLALDSHGVTEKVDVAPIESEDLARSKPAEAGEQDKSSVPLVDRLGQVQRRAGTAVR
jgi:hypothetical protein